MTADQIKHVLSTRGVAAIITTRNATFWVVDYNGNGGSMARYQVDEWDHDNELVTLSTTEMIRGDQFYSRQHINYGIIDEMQSLPV